MEAVQPPESTSLEEEAVPREVDGSEEDEGMAAPSTAKNTAAAVGGEGGMSKSAMRRKRRVSGWRREGGMVLCG